jgi:hypothetical protein
MITARNPFCVVVSITSARGSGIVEDTTVLYETCSMLYDLCTTYYYFRRGGILHGAEYFVPELTLHQFPGSVAQ